MGAPITFAREAQAWAGRAHMESTIAGLDSFTPPFIYSSVRDAQLN